MLMNFSDPESFFDQIARLKADAPVNYREIKRTLDPLNIVKAGEQLPSNSVEYFLKAWSVEIDHEVLADETTIYDAGEWLNILVGKHHGEFYLRKFSEPDGFFMGSQAKEIYPMYRGTDARRWMGDVVGMRAIAIHLCSRRNRLGMDRTRISQHASYVAHEVSLVTSMKYNAAIREAVIDFCNGQRLDLWETAINEIPDTD